MLNPLANIAIFLLPLIFGGYMSIVLLRFLMQYFKISFANPFGQFIINASNPLVIPVRKFIPAFGTIDTASLIVAFLTHAVFVFTLAIVARQNINFAQIIIWSVVGLITMQLAIFVAVIFVSIIASWLPDFRHQPIIRIATQLAEPVISPFRKMLPDLGGIDLSPMIALIIIQCIKIFLNSLAMLHNGYILGF